LIRFRKLDIILTQSSLKEMIEHLADGAGVLLNWLTYMPFSITGFNTMRKYELIHQRVTQNNGVANKAEFARLLMDDLQQASCLIYGERTDEEPVLLAELKTQAKTLTFYSGLFGQRIEFMVAGTIINDQYPALKYAVNGTVLKFYGRCSTIPQVCGVDLYLDKSYTSRVGDQVQQKLTIPVGKLYRSICRL
jgi:hypothetical protein